MRRSLGGYTRLPWSHIQVNRGWCIWLVCRQPPVRVASRGGCVVCATTNLFASRQCVLIVLQCSLSALVPSKHVILNFDYYDQSYKICRLHVLYAHTCAPTILRASTHACAQCVPHAFDHACGLSVLHAFQCKTYLKRFAIRMNHFGTTPVLALELYLVLITINKVSLYILVCLCL